VSYYWPEYNHNVSAHVVVIKCSVQYTQVLLEVFKVLFLVVVLFYVFCVVLYIVSFVTFPVLFVCTCVPNNCHRVATQLQLNKIYQIKINISKNNFLIIPQESSTVIITAPSFLFVLSLSNFLYALSLPDFSFRKHSLCKRPFSELGLLEYIATWFSR
jgi:hypothetical protein